MDVRRTITRLVAMSLPFILICNDAHAATCPPDSKPGLSLKRKREAA
jgi:hypothetical protein